MAIDIWVIGAIIHLIFFPLRYTVTKFLNLTGLCAFTFAMFITSSYSYLYEEFYPNIAVVNVFVYSVSLLELVERLTDRSLLQIFYYLTGIFGCVVFSHLVTCLPCFISWEDPDPKACAVARHDVAIICLVIIILGGFVILAECRVQQIVEPDSQEMLEKIGKSMKKLEEAIITKAYQKNLEIPNIHISRTSHDSDEKKLLLPDEMVPPPFYEPVFMWDSKLCQSMEM